jgi:hypothetical protein
MDWGNLASSADVLIKKFGQTITLSHSSYGEYDPDLGTLANTISIVVSTGVMFDYGEKEINGTSIIRGDKRLLISPIGIAEIVIGDLITVSTKSYTVTEVIETNPAGTNLLFEVSIRGVS